MNELAPAPEVLAATPPAPDDLFVMPASVSQKRFWLLEQMTPGNTALDIPIALELTGPLDVDLLERALQAIVDRHEILRTRFELIDGEPRQVIAPQATLTLHRAAVDSDSSINRPQRIRRAMDREAEKPVDFNRAPLLRAALLELAPDDHVLMITAHHIVSDGWSNGVIVRELATFYDALRLEEEPKLAPLAIQYADYVVWQEEWLKTDEFRQQLDYWRGQLAGELPVLDFPTDFPRQTVQPTGAILESRLLPAPLTDALKRLCQEEGVTIFMVFLAAYVALLHRYTGQERVLVGTTAANRNRPELEPLVGLFANLLVVSGEAAGAMTFRELLARQRDQSLGAFAHHEAPFELVLQELQQAGAARVPMQTHFLFQRAFMQPATCGELTLRPLHSVSPGSTFELTFGIVERAEGIRLQMEYRTSLYRRETVGRLLLHFQQLLESLAGHLDTPIDEIPLFADGEREEIETRMTTILSGAGEVNPEMVWADLDRQIDAHLLNGEGTFFPAHVPPGVALAALDARGYPLPLGIPGELYFAAPGLDSPQATPFLGRNGEDGGVELWGQASDIVRLHGFSFNVRAVEVALRAQPDVADAATALQPTASGANRLVARAVLKPGAATTGEAMRAALKEKLSDMLVPATIHLVPELRRDSGGCLLVESEPEPSLATKAEPSGDVPLHALVRQQLMEIWQRLLRADGLTIDSNFFESGGNSFLALRMMVEAGKLAGRQLPLALLLRGATIRDLARAILGHANEGGQEVIPVQPNGTQTPLFFLHGDWIGGGFYCHQLARDLGDDQPFYALPPCHMRDEKIVTMREMAAQHCAALRRQRPHGPYLIGGYCIGATVALEVARQLVAEGETVERLFLVDPPLWGGVALRGLWPWVDRLGTRRGWNLEKKIAFFDRTAVAFTRWWRKPLAAKLGTVLRQFGFKSVAPETPPADAVAEDVFGAEILDGLDFSTYFMTYRLYRFAPLAVPAMLLFPVATPPARLVDAVRRSRLDPARAVIETVPGNHTTCITQHTAALAEKMRGVAG
jgi:hypothetical protein